MARKLSTRAAGFLLLGLTLLTWAVLALEWLLASRISLVALATALMFTATLVLWPFANGARIREGALNRVPACHQCGAFLLAGFAFCLRCGAYPKAQPHPAA